MTNESESCCKRAFQKVDQANCELRGLRKSIEKMIERLCEGSFDESYSKTKQCIKQYESVYQKTLKEGSKTEVTEL